MSVRIQREDFVTNEVLDEGYRATRSDVVGVCHAPGSVRADYGFVFADDGRPNQVQQRFSIFQICDSLCTLRLPLERSRRTTRSHREREES
jgi:hypothetical protein